MRRPLILLLAFAALAIVAWLLWKRDRGTTLPAPLTDFAVRDTAGVSRIFIAEPGGGTVDLRRDNSGGWTVNGMPANPHPVRLLLKTFLRIEVRSPVPKSAEANVLRVMSTAARRVEIYRGGDTPEKIWFVGHATQDHFGTYMLLEIPGEGRSNAPYIMSMSGFSGFLSTRFHTKLDEWRGSTVFHYPDLSRIARVAVDRSTPGTSFRIAYAHGTLALLDSSDRPVAMDTLAVRDLMLQFKDLHYENIERSVPQALRDSVLGSAPEHRITVVDVDGAERHVPLWRKPAYTGQKNMEFEPLGTEDPGRYYALLDDSLMVVVQRHLFDRITPPLGALRHP